MIAALYPYRQWVVWRYDIVKRKRQKVPYDARTGRHASSTDPTTWSTYQEALAAVRRQPKRWIGIGFVVSSEDEFCGIDLDNCIDADGEVALWALVIVERVNSYTEISPSGKGLRIWLRGTLPPDGRRKDWKETIDGEEQRRGIEMYDEGRFFTITGRHWAGTPETIEDRQAELEAVHGDTFPPQEKLSPPIQSYSPLDMPDEELLERAHRARNGWKFDRLWRGDKSDYADDWSRADLALCCLLRWWTRADEGRMDRLFRRSGLMRPKWDRRLGKGTYGSVTIAKALLGPVYDPPSPRASRRQRVIRGDLLQRPVKPAGIRLGEVGR